MTFINSLMKNGVAVIGAGNMGSGIAQKIAQSGIPVELFDTTLELAENGKKKIENLLNEGVNKKIFDQTSATETARRISCRAILSNQPIHSALVIEAIFEDRDLKTKLFRDLNKLCTPEAIFATNTSSLSVSELAKVSGREDRFGGLHFFYHPAKNKLLEVIPAETSSGATMASLWQFSRAIKKIAIETKDRAGFAVNRFFVPWLNESVTILEEGVANIPTIEAAAKEGFGCGMGPFELMNVTGIPIAFHAATFLKESLGEFYKPAPLLKKQVALGSSWDLSGEVDPRKIPVVKDILLGITFYITSTLALEGVASLEDTDRGAAVGLRWEKGPFHLMNEMGTKESNIIVGRFVDRASRRGFKLDMPSNLASIAGEDRPWPLSFINFETRSGIARIVFNRPEAMNALNPSIVGELYRHVHTARKDPAVQTIIFEGVGKAFVAGADIKFFVDALDNKNFPCIYEFTRQGHELFDLISNCGKKTIAFVNGMALGGGFELALACNEIVVGPEAIFGLPETGIGIYPGLGGTQRLPRKVGKEIARYLTFTGQMVKGTDALAINLADGSVTQEDLFSSASFELSQKIVDAAKKRASGSEKTPKWVRISELLFSDRATNATLSGSPPPLPEEESLRALAEKTLKTLSFKAPVALKIASELIDVSLNAPIEEGMKLELSRLEEVFATKDAYEGLSTVGIRRPAYSGR